MTTKVIVRGSQSQLAKLITRVQQGEEVVFEKDGAQVAVLKARRRPARARRKGGFLKGKVWIADDFDAPLPADVLGAFEGR